jgi:hypothetical protein
MRLLFRPFMLLSPVALVLTLVAVPPTLGAAADACTLVPATEVAQIIGNDAPIFRQQPPTDRDGVRVSSCVYQQARGAGNTGNVQFNIYDSAAAAEAGLKKYVDAMVKLGATTEADTAGRVPATFVTTRRGSGEMYVVKGNVLLGAGVATVSPDGKVMPLRDRSRALLAAALSKL